jgi:hypothetical protein
MEDGDSEKNMEENFLGERLCKATYDGDVFQPIWIRHSSVLSYILDREFVERKFDFVLYLGTLLWFCFFITKIF